MERGYEEVTRTFTIRCTGNTWDDWAQCIHNSVCWLSIGGHAGYHRIKNAHFICGLWFEFSAALEGYVLSCGHRYHKECIQQYVAYLIENSYVQKDELICPAIDCNKEIKEHHVERVNLAQTMQLYYRFQILKSKIVQHVSVQADCLCGNLFLAPIVKQITQCPSCGDKIWIQCGKRHDETEQCDIDVEVE
jgi:hypothetical protein